MAIGFRFRQNDPVRSFSSWWQSAAMFFACLLAERGLSVDHVTVWRWVQRYAPEIQCRLRPRLRPTNDSWRVDGTYIRVKGKWVYCIPGCRLHGCDDRLSSAGLNATQQRLSAFSRRPWAERTIRRRGLSTPTSTPVIHRPSCGSKAEETLEENCRHRSVQYFNNVLEQDHRVIGLKDGALARP